MNEALAIKVCQLNNAFYRDQAASFSSTRHAKWPGWVRCLDEVRSGMSDRKSLSVLDVACGNLRFEEFLAKHLTEQDLQVHALDVCDDLFLSKRLGEDQRFSLEYHHLDVIEALSCDRLSAWFAEHLPEQGVDLSVSFGFMHHIPLPEWRRALLRDLVSSTALGGIVCISFWRFMDDEDMARRARATHRRALDDLTEQGFFAGIKQEGRHHQNGFLETIEVGSNDAKNRPFPSYDHEDPFNKGDFLLGWRNTPGAYRYCHSFNDDELDELLDTVSNKVERLIRFRSDGRSGNLNEYAILELKR